MLARILRTFRIGKWSYFRGHDLMGNRYFERPNPQSFDPLNPRFTKRSIEYKQEKPMYAFTGHDIPPAWASWLRHSRLHPPSLSELEAEEARYSRLQANVAQLDADQAAIRAQTIENQAKLMQSSSAGDAAQKKLPSGQVATDPAVIGAEEELTTPVQPKKVVTFDTTDEEGRRKKEEDLQKEWFRKRQEMRKSPLSAFKPASNPDDNFQPQSWTPRAR